MNHSIAESYPLYKYFESKLDYLLIALIIALITTITYHPFYFGDELIPWLMSERHNGSFLGALHEFSQYKPRLIFNALWIFISDFGLPRTIPAFIVFISEFLSLSIIYFIVSIIFPGKRLVAWLAVFAFISNRFGIVIWYDYLSGIIEALSFTFFLAGLFVLNFNSQASKNIYFLPGCCLLLCAALVHERYIAPVFVVSIYMAFFNANLKIHKKKLIFFAFIPGITFLLLIKIIGSRSVFMGTSGQGVSFDLGTCTSLITYLFNVLFQVNYGHDWFVGYLNWGHDKGKLLSICALIVFAAIYFRGFLGAKNSTHKGVLLAFVLSALALIFMASLPGLDRQEGRWMYPVMGLVSISVVLYFRENISTLFFGALILVNSIHFFTGSLNAVANVTASKFSEGVGESLAKGTALGTKGILIADHSATWAIGGGFAVGNNGYSGELFSLANSLGRVQIDPWPETQKTIPNEYDFVFIYTGQLTTNGLPKFTQLSVDAARKLINPDEDFNTTQNEIVIGHQNNWDNWSFASKSEAIKDLILRPRMDGFIELNSEDIDNKILIYTAKSVLGGAVPMRIQVNWMDAQGKFISAYIKVVTVGAISSRYSALISAPKNAHKGLVYATLHDDASDDVLLEKVAIQKLMQ